MSWRKRSGWKRPSFTPAGPVTITRADGTVVTQQPYRRKESDAILHTSRRRNPKPP